MSVGVGVGRGAQHLLGGRVRPSANRPPPPGKSAAVDEQITGAIGCYRHRRLPTFAVIGHLSDAMCAEPESRSAKGRGKIGIRPLRRALFAPVGWTCVPDGVATVPEDTN